MNDPEAQRLDEAFRLWNHRRDSASSRTPNWTPELRAERWAGYVLECQTNLAAALVPEIFSRIDLLNLPDWIPQGYRDLAEMLLTLRDPPKANDPNRLIAICGDRGRGKTAMACGLIRAYCRLGMTALYTRVADYFAALDGVPWEQKPGVKARFARPDIIVIDEIQVRSASPAMKDWQDNELTTLVDHHYGDGHIVVFLSNFKPDALQKNLGDSINRRLDEGHGIFETDWPRLAVLAHGTHPEPIAKVKS